MVLLPPSDVPGNALQQSQWVMLGLLGQAKLSFPKVLRKGVMM